MDATGLIDHQFWGNGPQPGGFYSCPGGRTTPSNIPVKRTMNPIVTGTSVLAVKFSGGIIIAADMLGSYGSLARFRNCPRLLKVNNTTVLGAGGDYADYQFLKSIIEQRVIDEECLDDGFSYKPKSLYSWLTRVMYNRRSNFNPLWNTILVGGLQDGEPCGELGGVRAAVYVQPGSTLAIGQMLMSIEFGSIRNVFIFLGYVDKIGTAFDAPTLATGYGAYIAQPMLRDAYEKNSQMSEAEARALIDKCLTVLFYRDARAFNKYQLAIVTSEGAKIEGPLKSETNWSIAHMVKGYD